MKNVKAVLFDMDGVIIDSEPWHTLARARVFGKLGIPKETEKKIVLGARKSDYWNELNAEFSLGAASADELVKAEFGEILSLIKENGIRECAHLKDLLEYLKSRGIKIAVASSSFREYAEGVLEHLGIRNYFCAAVCGDEITRPKPFPDIYLAAAEKVGAKPCECFAVEDSRTGTLAAQNADIACIGYSGTETAAKTDFSACEFVSGDMLEIKKYIDKFTRV